MDERTGREKTAIALAACSAAWVIGAGLFYRSGGINPAGLVPSLGSLVALWGAIRSDHRTMWFGTAICLFASVAFVFSIGLVVAPAALALASGSFILSRRRHVSASRS
jgi:hypothetical protein